MKLEPKVYKEKSKSNYDYFSQKIISKMAKIKFSKKCPKSESDITFYSGTYLVNLPCL